jgi:hypothetical protein
MLHPGKCSVASEEVAVNNNEAGWDRGARVVVGLALLVLLAVLGSTIGWWLSGLVSLVALVLLVTGAVGFCPLYWMFGLNTCPMHP